jgi:signal transduction histidine kinase
MPLVEGREIVLQADIPDDLPRVFGDERRLEQVFFNLIGNSIKFTEKGNIAIRARCESERVCIFVSDTGAGILPEDQERIFEPFNRGGKVQETGFTGTGLGLAISREIVKLHGGDLTLEESGKAGSVFEVCIPRADETADEALQVAKTPVLANESSPVSIQDNAHLRPKCLGSMFRILAVDDEATNLRVIEAQLEGEGYSVDGVLGGTQAIQAVNEAIGEDSSYDLMIVDLMMPSMSGNELVREIRTSLGPESLPIIVLTASHDPNDLARSLEAGANDYLIKPFPRMELLLRVRAQLAICAVRKTEQVRSLGMLARAIAHDLNNTLGAILNYGSLLKIATAGDKKAGEYLCNIDECVEGSKKLLQQILSSTRGRNGKELSVEVSTLVQGVERILRAGLPRGVTFQTVSPEKKIFTPVDSSHFQQIAINMCLNAIQAVKKSGGKVTLAAREVSASELPDEIKGNAEKSWMGLFVIDNGSGIPAGFEKKIFSPFVTTKVDEQGVGLGLSIVKSIVERYQGTITVSCDNGETCFSVYLPVEELGEQKALNGVSKQSTSKGRVLYIDDDPSVLRAGAELLRNCGYLVFEADAATSGLKEFTTNPMDYDWVLCDVTLSDMKLDEVLSSLQEVRRDVSILLTSGCVQEGEVEPCQGIEGFIPKPWEEEIVLAVLTD